MLLITLMRRNIHIKLLLPVILLLITMVSVVMGLNAYKYFRAKDNLASKILDALNTDDVERLRTFATFTTNQLLTLRDQYRETKIDITREGQLNGTLFPLLKNQKDYSGIILADGNGNTYLLSREGSIQNGGDTFITMITRPEKGGAAKLIFSKWQDAQHPFEQWIEKGIYHPDQQPWFPDIKERPVWSKIYKLDILDRPGVSVSISWSEQNKTGPENLKVLAINIPMDRIEGLLSQGSDLRTKLLFLTDPRKGYFYFPGRSPDQEEDLPKDWYSKIVTEIRDKWRAKAAKEKQYISIEFNRERWLVTQQPISDSGVIWLGLAIREKDLLGPIGQTLFSLDLYEIIIAIGAGILVLFLAWRSGLFTLLDNLVPKDPLLRISQYLNMGEGTGIEFKSTVRMNLKTKKYGKEIELAWLKAVVAFLNSSGGALLIGVDDNGKIIGLDHDGFESPDRCLLHLKNLINQHIGAEFSDFIQIHLVDTDKGNLLLIECKPARQPVFLKIGKNEEFYIRSGPSSMKLSPSQTVNYLLQKKRISS